MFNLSELVSHLQAATPFNVRLSGEFQQNLNDQQYSKVSEVPIVSIGALQLIRIADIQLPGAVSDFESSMDDIEFRISIHLVTSTENLPTHWNTLYRALRGWTPTNYSPESFSSLTYSNGDAMGMNNNRIWWLDVWKINFPALALS